MSRRHFLIAGTLVVVGCALYFGLTRQTGLTFRRPASQPVFAHVDYEIIDSQDDEFIRNLKLRLVQDLDWIEEGQSWRVKLSAFTINKDGRNVPACEKYRDVIIHIAASGVAMNGEIPKLIVTTPCREQNQEFVLPAISFSQVRERVQAQTEWDQGESHFLSQRLDEEWFLDWHIREIELVPLNSAPSIQIDTYEIQAVRPGGGNLTIEL